MRFATVDVSVSPWRRSRGGLVPSAALANADVQDALRRPGRPAHRGVHVSSLFLMATPYTVVEPSPRGSTSPRAVGRVSPSTTTRQQSCNDAHDRQEMRS